MPISLLMARSALILLLVTSLAAHGAVPRLFIEKNFSPVEIAEAVNYFVDLGENAAVEDLMQLASSGTQYNKKGFLVEERVGWVCRILFEGKGGNSLRPPNFGVLDWLPPPDMLEKNWPQFPVAVSASTFFVLWEGYITIEGTGEDPKAYIEYCRKNGIFRTRPVTVPAKSKVLEDLAALRNSAAWKSIKWTYTYGGQKCVLNEDFVWKFIDGQARRTP